MHDWQTVTSTLEFPYRRSLGAVVGGFAEALREKRIVGSVTAEGRVLVPPLEFDPDTGEINWSCPCLGGMADGPCGEEFKAAFSCFVFSDQEPKGVECIDRFRNMQDCFREHPDVYGRDVLVEDEEEEQQPAAIVTQTTGPVATGESKFDHHVDMAYSPHTTVHEVPYDEKSHPKGAEDNPMLRAAKHVKPQKGN